MTAAVFFFVLGLLVGHLLGVLSVSFIVGEGIDWSRHECRTCVDWEDDTFTPTCQGRGPRQGMHTEPRDRCDKWRGGRQ